VAALKASLMATRAGAAAMRHRAPPEAPAAAAPPDAETLQPGRGRSEPSDASDWEILW
jgi:hypothetical protein